MTREELKEMETEVRKHLEFAKSVHASTKDLEKQLKILNLAQIGMEAVLEAGVYR